MDRHICLSIKLIYIAYLTNIRNMETTYHLQFNSSEKEENGTPMKDLRTSATTMSPDSNANDPFLKNNSKAIYRPQSGKVATRNMGPVRSTSSNNAKKRVVRMLIVLVLLFFIAWTPTWILNMWYVVNRARALKLVRRFPHMVSIG